jgi:hypothetical protein
MKSNQIKKVNPYPNELQQIAQRFLSLETEYNAIVKKVTDEKTSFNNKYQQSVLELGKNKTAQYNSEEQKFINGEFLPLILSSTLKEWQTEKNKYSIIKFTLVGVSILSILVLPWYASIIGAVGSWFILDSIEKKITDYISKLSQYVSHSKNIFTAQEQSAIKSISLDLKNKIEDAEGSDRNRLSQLYNLINQDKNEKNKRNATKYNQRVAAMNTQHQQIINSFIAKASLEISLLNSRATVIKNDLNLLPETFDNNAKSWSSNSAVKGKDIIADIFRVGQVTLSIKLNTSHTITLPRCIPFINQSNISFDCNSPQEIKEAIRQSHNLISRTLLALPPGKVKLSVIDPQALGSNAAPFTPLDKEIGGGLASNQNADIEIKLASIIRNIERIIKDCLQNKYPDLAAYNIAISDVQENYNLLVIYNFPNGFSDTSIKNILNIIKSGPKAGVSCIFINDRNAKPTYSFKWTEFDALPTTKLPILTAVTGNSTYENDKSLPHDLIVHYINTEYPNASTVKVPFTKYLLPKKDWWQAKSHEQIEVPIGKFGSDIQSIKITTLDTNGVMLIGTTGSGKSNLLHVIITNAICKYAPDQLELYLIDFKGGVEFSPYADTYIPHLRGIAITSERDFGLSILEKVEKEMIKRQVSWEAISIRDIAGFRSTYPNEIMPRILLIVDEFQLFFAQEDEIKNRAEKSLNNLLKQGRVFGINILFSSQTLTGQNNIHSSIKDQFEIRIALKCLDADVDKIFDEKNKAPKDLLGKGDGIYNDKKGMAIYNKKFQAFYVEDSRVDLKEFLKDIENYTLQMGNKFIDKPHIVFRSSAKALLEKSSLAKFVQNKNSISNTFHLWLGQPISIDDDVRAVLKRESGGNLLIVGSDVGIAVRVLFSSITSLFIQPIQKESSFYFFNFYDTDTEEYKNLNKPFKAVRDKLNIEIVEEKNIKATLEKIKKELETRQTSAVSNYQNIFIVIASLQRGRIFNKENNNLTEETKLLSSVIKDGSNKGIHTIIQIDSMDSFMDRIFDRDKLLPEFSQRVATQMNEDNSRKLLRSKDAMLLGSNRAYYYWDTENKLIKFKPFEIPDLNFFKSIINNIINK